MIGGQILSLLLTLVAIPVIYSLFDDLEKMKIKARVKRAPAKALRFGAGRGAAAPAVPAVGSVRDPRGEHAP